MHFQSITQAAQAVTKMAEDLWNNRKNLLNDRKFLVASYRVSITETSENFDDTVTSYFHLVIGQNRWWYTISKEMYKPNGDQVLMFADNDEMDTDVKGTSWRSYMFGDIVVHALEKEYEAISDHMIIPGRPYLHDTFPVREFRENLPD